MASYKQIFKTCMKKPANFTRVDFSDPSNKLTFKKAINFKCLDCCGGTLLTARNCGVTTCALYPFKKTFPTGKEELDTTSTSPDKPKRKYNLKPRKKATP